MEYKRLPMGISDFLDLRQQSCYFVDKTKYIHKLERISNFLFFHRPRRFGKSLFLSMLQFFYDINERDNFEALFGDTWIAKEDKKHPERKLLEFQGKYQVLKLDFSEIKGPTEKLEENFENYCCRKLNSFLRKYRKFYADDVFDEAISAPDSDSKLYLIKDYAKEMHQPLCLIIDEYDNITNNVLSTEGHEVYHAMTHSTGFYRDEFKLYKSTFSRIIMMGVSPITLDDLTSGYNIATNVTLEKGFNGMLGFSYDEVLEIIRYYQEQGAICPDANVENMMAEMKAWYDGYCFSSRVEDTEPRIFNSSMVLRYINFYIDNGRAPESLIVPNTKTDYAKLNQLIKLDQISGDRKSVILEIANNGFTKGSIVESFPAMEMMEESKFKSLLFYYGMVTITGMDDEIPVLGIPNNNVRKQYYEYLINEYSQISPIDTAALDNCFKQAALDGDGLGLLRFLCQSYKENSSIRSLIEGERNLQGYMSAFFSLSPHYLTAPEVELNHGYCDFFLMPKANSRNTKHSYIIELKYLSVGEYTEEKAQTQWDDAVKQIHGYAVGKQVQALCAGTQLHTIVVQMKGHDLMRLEEV